MASGGRRRLVPCFLGILLNALIGKLHYVISRVIGNALLINNPELGPSLVSVSAPAVNTNVENSAGNGQVHCGIWSLPGGYRGYVVDFLCIELSLKL